MSRILLSIFAYFLCLQSAFAQETWYISDTLQVPLRNGEGEQFQIVHQGLVSGTAVSLLESREQTGYSRVKTASGIEGWVRTENITAEPTAAMKLKQMIIDLNYLTEKNNQLQLQLDKLASQNPLPAETETSAEKVLIAQTDTTVSTEQAAIPSSDNLEDRNAKLLKENQLLLNQIDLLKNDIARLKDDATLDYFLYGGILVVLSTILAAWVPSLRNRRRYDGWA